MNGPAAVPLTQRVAASLQREIAQPVGEFARQLGEAAGAAAVLFYGSNLRTGSLEGVLDYYVLLPGPPESGVWPRVSYHEWRPDGWTGPEDSTGDEPLRAKVATMTLAKFQQAAAGELYDTTIWARFVQPSAMIWRADAQTAAAVESAVAAAAMTAARLAAALGPAQGRAEDYWAALFRETYRAEFRVESAGRENAILSVNRAHFDGLLPLAWRAAGIAFASAPLTCDPQDGDDRLTLRIDPAERARILRWWRPRRRLGKALNVVRLIRATTTFDGAARYAAWKVERHTGVPVTLTPWRERHPILAAPGVLLSVWRARRKARASSGQG